LLRILPVVLGVVVRRKSIPGILIPCVPIRSWELTNGRLARILYVSDDNEPNFHLLSEPSCVEGDMVWGGWFWKDGGTQEVGR
jgi:hypothetical protein